jgi:hypothetical protein
MRAEDLFDEELTQEEQGTDVQESAPVASEQPSGDGGYISSLDEDTRKKLLEAYDVNNTKPLFSSMVDAFYKPRVKSEEDVRKQSGLQTALGALADAVSSGIEGAAGGAPVRPRNTYASQLANHANEVLRAKNDALREQYARAKMGAKGQDISLGARAYAESQNAIQRYLASKQKESELKMRDQYNHERLALDRLNKDRAYALGVEKLRQKAEHDADMLKETKRRNNIYSSHVARTSRGGDGQDFWLEDEDGGQMVTVPKSGYAQVKAALIEEGYNALSEQLKKKGVSKYLIPEIMKGYDKSALMNMGVNTPKGRETVRLYGRVSEEKSPKPSGGVSPIEKEVKRLVNQYPDANVDDLTEMAYRLGVPTVINVSDLIKKYRQ